MRTAAFEAAARDKRLRYAVVYHGVTMKPTAVVVVAAALLCLPGIGSGGEPGDATQGARDDVAAELSQCAAYYALVAAKIEASEFPSANRNKGVAQAKQVSDIAIGMAGQLSSAEVAAARMELARQTMQREMKNDWANFSPIAVRYMRSCKDIVEHPDERFAYWMTEKSKLPDGPPAKPK
jgi:hypothetical protein